MRQVWDIDSVSHTCAECGPWEPCRGTASSSEPAVRLLWMVPPVPGTANTQQGQEPRLELVLNLFFFGNYRLPSGHRLMLAWKRVRRGLQGGARLCVGTSSFS